MQPTDTTSFSTVLSRLFWMMIGPLLLAVLAYSIIRFGNGWFTAADIGFLGVLIALVLVRWLEFRGGHPQTATGEPAAPEHFRRYAVATIVVGLLVYVAANLIGNFYLVP